jgi:hypothetical protein
MKTLLTRSEACALQTLFAVLSGPLPVVPDHISGAEQTNRDRVRLWRALEERVKIRSRSLIELQYSSGAIIRAREPGMSKRFTIFLLKLEMKTGRPDISVEKPYVVNLNITLNLVCDPPEWHVESVHLTGVDPADDRVLLEGLDLYSVQAEAA